MIFGGVGSGGLCGCGAGCAVEGKSSAGAVGWAGGRSRRARRFSPRKPRYKPATRAAAKKIVANGIMSGIKNAFTGFSTVRRGAVFRIRKDCENDTDKALGAAYGGNEVRLLGRQERLICCGKSVFPERHSPQRLEAALIFNGFAVRLKAAPFQSKIKTGGFPLAVGLVPFPPRAHRSFSSRC